MSEYIPASNTYRVSIRTAAVKDTERGWSRVVLETVVNQYVQRKSERVSPEQAGVRAGEALQPGYHAVRVGDRVLVSRDDVAIGTLVVVRGDARSEGELLDDAIWLAASEDARWLTAELEHQRETLEDATRVWWDETLAASGVYALLSSTILARFATDTHLAADNNPLLLRGIVRETVETYRRDIAESIYCHAIVWARIELLRHFPDGDLARVSAGDVGAIFVRDSHSCWLVGDAIEYMLGIWEVDLTGLVRERPEVQRVTRNVADPSVQAAIERFTGRTAAPAVSFSAPALTFLNDPHTRAVIRSMWDMPNWRSGEQQMPQYRHDGVRVYVPDRAEHDSQTVDVAWQRVLELDDNTASTFLICIGKWFADTGGNNLDLPKTWIHVADVLGFRGIKKHAHGGYRPEQKEEARRHIMALNHIWVQSEEEVYEARGRKKRVRVDSRLLEVALESEPGSDGAPEPYAFRIAPGEWARSYLGTHNRLTAQLLQPVMTYDPYRQRMAMRLGIYLASQWRIRASSRNYAQPWRVRTLLAGACLDLPERNLQRFRDQFENALDTLQADGVVAAWEYERDSELPDRQWFALWLDWTVRISPPPVIVEHYASIASGRSKAIGAAKRAEAGARKRD